ncbi:MULTISPECIES: hypothetical protein [Bacteria]|uniref:hypothetical protein n=1 Tax=Bacteria TaxID=2 RepID=UPI003C79F2BE
MLPPLDDFIAMPLQVTPAWQTLLASMANAVVVAPEMAEGRGAASLLEGFCGAIGAVMLDALKMPASMTRTQASLYGEALQVIDLQHRDPDFNVDALSQRMMMSRSNLYAVFTAAGGTPRRAIEQRRVLTARTVLTAGRPQSEAAAVSGFATTRKMQRALARAEDRKADSPSARARRSRGSNNGRDHSEGEECDGREPSHRVDRHHSRNQQHTRDQPCGDHAS